MISRFFKKTTTPKGDKKPMTAHPSPKPHKTDKIKKILTAEGWKRLMMRKYSKGKK